MDVVRTVREGVRLIPCGRVRQSGSEYAVKFDADYDRAADIRSTIVVAISMPVTILVGLFFMHSLGLTLNMLTLLSVGMSVGILVTNSIVVLEAIVSKLGETGDPKESARLGAGEVALAVVASAGRIGSSMVSEADKGRSW